MEYHQLLLFLLLFFCHFQLIKTAPSFDDNEFAEFEIADEEPQVSFANNDVKEEHKVDEIKADAVREAPKQTDPTEDFSFLADEDEFEQAEKDLETNQGEADTAGKQGDTIKPLTFADVPSHFRSNWSSYQIESIALFVIIIYVINYLYGKTKNYSIALKWFSDNREKLEQQFALVGDDGTSTEEMEGHLIRETEFSYTVWSTGRTGCKGMLTQIKLRKRQDLLGILLNIIRPQLDRVVHKIDMDPNEMDSFVLIFGQRKSVLRAVKEMHDLSVYVTEKKNFEKLQLLPSFCVYAEVAEIVPAIIDSTTVHFLKRCEKYIEYVHISDQYSGAKQQDGQNSSKLPETHPTLIFSFILNPDNDDTSIDELLLNFTFYILERVKNYRLSKEGKIRADRKRQNAQENFLKMTHQQRQEAAQIRREEKTRERKQKVMEEEDPDRQRRLEKLEQKRDAKAKQPRIKQFKIK
uniref:PAT complex subunit CCDC47 n=1 Tax=Meloidogyne floridensis TaxID=298350 RepID=A0A915P3A5_9BILA